MSGRVQRRTRHLTTGGCRKGRASSTPDKCRTGRVPDWNVCSGVWGDACDLPRAAIRSDVPRSWGLVKT